MRASHSQEYFQKAKQVMVGGVNNPIRTFEGMGCNPLVIKYGRGAKLHDHDNNVYTDYCLSGGSLILGHAHRNVILSAKKTLEKGISFGTTTREEVNMARLICSRVPSIELVRFVNSGTEAAMSAVRLARGFTKREIMVKFDGCQHGHFDDSLAKAGSGLLQPQESTSLGIPRNHVGSTISLPYNDKEMLEETLDMYKDDIACVIIEPVAAHMGVILPDLKFLRMLRELTVKYNIILIFDEVTTGFRAHPGCMQSQVNIIPDMTCLGRIIGSGFPIGAYGGRKDIMNCLAPSGGVYQTGTFSGNPVVMRAGYAGLRLLTNDLYAALNQSCAALGEEVNGFLHERKIEAHLTWYGSMMSVFFRRKAVSNYYDAKAAAGGPLYAAMFRHLMDAGIYFPPDAMEPFFISCMHTKRDLTHLADQLKSFFVDTNMERNRL
ncbi:MAG: glutamate-1-semialdehyde 2,1-aminomutase [Candidatus Omnitrophica bacterium]|nr:glutamate-1-semialdehyde 2,1-aminomutase [Candidatus Omnitrophota bacterium]